MTPFCHSCGEPVATAEPITIGRWVLSERTTERDGVIVDVTAAQSALLYELARAKGRFVSASYLGDIITDEEVMNPINVIRVHVSKMRRKLGNLCPIETRIGAGYRWHSGE